MNRWLPVILIFAILAAFRVVGSMLATSFPNFQPLPALLLCSVVFLHGRQRWALPLFVWLVTYPFTSYLQGYSIFRVDVLLSQILGISAIVGIALWTRRNPSMPRTLGASLLAAGIFYFLTNLVSFSLDPLYAKTWEGFTRAQWTGPTSMGPTWIFLRNLAAANFLFTGIFLLARKSLPISETAPAPVLAR